MTIAECPTGNTSSEGSKIGYGELQKTRTAPRVQVHDNHIVSQRQTVKIIMLNPATELVGAVDLWG